MSVRAFILAGGFGTRLRPVSGETPKALMPIAGQPFLHRLVDRLVGQGISDIVLCLGHRAELITDHFLAYPVRGAIMHVSIEPEPRGTAGALRVAERFWQADNLIVNGDTEMACDYTGFHEAHLKGGGTVSIGLARVADATRFGRVESDADGRVLAFHEKDGAPSPGLVNAGLYAAKLHALDAITETGSYSIERDWLPALLKAGKPIMGILVADEFTDIGTPEDYWRLANQA